MRGTRAISAIPAGVATALVVAATAAAGVIVYQNDFSNGAEFDEIAKSGGGGECDRSYRKKSDAMRAAVEQGPATCAFRLPVQGDSDLPSHDVRVDGRILEATPNSIRGGAFLEITVRAGGGGVGYALRVFPEKERFELLRGPEGGEGFPVQGRSKVIKPVNARNKLRLIAAGADIRAFVNGEEVASVTDDNPGQVTGRKVRFAVGGEKESAKDVVAVFKGVSVGVVPAA